MKVLIDSVMKPTTWQKDSQVLHGKPLPVTVIVLLNTATILLTRATIAYILYSMLH